MWPTKVGICILEDKKIISAKSQQKPITQNENPCCKIAGHLNELFEDKHAMQTCT